METLSREDGDGLLALARAAIRERFDGSGAVRTVLDALAINERMEDPRATFVTLKTPDPGGGPERLRGCIGTMEAVSPLYRSIIDNAVRSAFQDPRFAPLTAEELPGVRISISVLTPLEPVRGPEDVVPGMHGVELQKEGYRAVFLPEVAEEQGWDTETLLHHLAAKAGIPGNEWRGGALAIFRSQCFGEPPAGATT